MTGDNITAMPAMVIMPVISLTKNMFRPNEWFALKLFLIFMLLWSTPSMNMNVKTLFR